MNREDVERIMKACLNNGLINDKILDCWDECVNAVWEAIKTEQPTILGPLRGDDECCSKR